ncbi:MAG: FAD-dependent oxidoreductase [Candidatus Eisenbacteria bacterium]
MNHGRADVLVLGAGLQGSGVALELARRGIPVMLIDRDTRPMNRSSLRNEGKIHLGLIYANDRSLDTAFLQLEGALCFRSIVSRWVETSDAWSNASTPFHYLVSADSLMGPERLAEHYAAVEERCRWRLEQDPGLDYLGLRPERLIRRLSDAEIADHFDPVRVPAGFATEERAVDPAALADALRRAVARASLVTFAPSRVVRAITEEPGGFRVEGDWRDGTWCVRAEQVVNATWERRLALDRQIGLAPPPDLLHRLKFRIIARLPETLRDAPSVTMVLGRYGDVVVRADGTAYLSWYPVGLRGWSHEIEPPEAWDAACGGAAPAALAREIAGEAMTAIDAWYPGIVRCEPLLVDAGVIVAIGRSDVDDATSGLHDRSHIGVTTRRGYHTVDPGKLTTAPLFAIETADRVEAHRSARNTVS